MHECEDGGDSHAEDSGSEGRFTYHVDIPEPCKIPKLFREEPGKALVKEIREYVAEQGESHTWWGHTHTRPPNGAPVKYLGRFELPERFYRSGRRLVCPACRPNLAHFGKRDGFCAWFPEEMVVRLIGPDCFVTINKQGHFDAVDELNRREQRERETEFLVSQRDQHRLALSVLMIAQRVAVAIDAFGAELRYRIYDTLNLSSLWRNVRTGELSTTREVADIQKPGNVLFLTDRFGSLEGHRLLDANLRRLEPKFAAHIGFLEEALALPDDDWTPKVRQLASPELAQLAKKLGAALDAARSLRAEIMEIQAFLSPTILGTLRRWGSPETPGSPTNVYVRREGMKLKIGDTERRAVTLPIPPDLELEIPSLARLTARNP